MEKKKRYLAIDGGGTKGIVSLVYLSYIEYQTGVPISKIFDIIAGSSSGGILSSILTVPHKDDYLLPKAEQRPQYTANEVMSIYRRVSKEAFECDLLFSIKNLWGLLGPRYDSSKLSKIFDELADVKAKDLLTEVLCTAYDLERQAPCTFNSMDPEDNDLKIKEFALATSAAPTYFKPHRIPNKGLFVDGAIYAPTPANWLLMGIERLISSGADNLKEELNKTTLVSIGTGSLNPATSKKYKDAEKWGLLKWVISLFGILDDGVTDSIDGQTRRLLGNNHFRINVKLDDENDYSIDEIGEEEIGALYRETKRSIKEPDFQDLRKLCVELQQQLHDEGTLPDYITPGEILPFEAWEKELDKALGI